MRFWFKVLPKALLRLHRPKVRATLAKLIRARIKRAAARGRWVLATIRILVIDEKIHFWQAVAWVR